LKATIKLQEQAIDCKNLTESESQESEAERVRTEDLVNEVKSLQKQVKQLNDHNDALTKFINEMRCANRQSENNLADVLAQGVKQTEKIRKLESKISKSHDFDRMSDEQNTNISNLRSEITAWKLRCSELQAIVADLELCETKKTEATQPKESATDQSFRLNNRIQKIQEESEVYMKYWTTAKTKYQQEKISHKKTKENSELEKRNFKNCQEHMQALNEEFEKVTVERDDFKKEIKNLTKTRNLLEQEIASTRFECEDDDDGFSLVGKKKKDFNSKSQNSKIVNSKSQNTLSSSKSLQTITESNKSGNHACCTCVIPMQNKIETLKQESTVQTELINSMLN